jgi:uncharacterized protein YrrD
MHTLDETTNLISAGKVTGTAVYNTEGDHLGEIKDVMLDKRSGKIGYALMSFGGFLGWANGIIPCLGSCSSTTPVKAAMWWA